MARLSTSISSLLCAHSRSSPLAPGLFKPRGAWPHEYHTSSSSSSSWPDTDRAPSFRRGYHRKTHAALKYCGAADVLSLLSLPPYSSTRLPIGITSFFPDPSTRTHARVIGTSMDHDFTTTVFITEEGRPQRRLRSAKRHLLSTPSLTSSAPLLTLLFLSSPLS